MTRSASLTVRLPGASTAPATRTRTCFQTGAVKQSRKADNQVASTGGATAGPAAGERCVVIASVNQVAPAAQESSIDRRQPMPTRPLSPPAGGTSSPRSQSCGTATDIVSGRRAAPPDQIAESRAENHSRKGASSKDGTRRTGRRPGVSIHPWRPSCLETTEADDFGEAFTPEKRDV